jgi:c-di-GMP-binding flagellar brake protein YcgR
VYNLIVIIIFIVIIFLIAAILRHFKDMIRFFSMGFDSSFKFRQIHMLWTLAKNAGLEDPTSLYFSIPVLDRTISQLLTIARARGQDKTDSFNAFLTKLYEFRTEVELSLGKKGLESTKELDVGQVLRIILTGKGVFSSKILANGRNLIIEVPKKDKTILITGLDWIGKDISVYLWRKNDAAYVFDTAVLDSSLYNGQNVLYLAHTRALMRTQNRKSIRVPCKIPAQIFIVNLAVSDPFAMENSQGLKCMLEDISETGALIRIGGEGLKDMEIKLQFQLNDSLVIMAGLVRNVKYDAKLNQSLLHFEATLINPSMKNTILSYVYNVLPQEEKDVLDVMNLIEEDENQVSEEAEGLDKEIDFGDTELGETMDMPTEAFFQGEME